MGDDMVEEDFQSHGTGQGKLKTSKICPPKLHRMTVHTCVIISYACSRPLCKNCQYFMPKCEILSKKY